MSDQIMQPQRELTAKSLFSRDDVKAKFQEMLGNRSAQFITSVLQIVASNNLLAKADPNSIYNAAATAATLDLPLNNNLGFAFIIPFNTKQPDGTYKSVAQFQISYRGLIQLAMRSGQFKTISATAIYEGQIKTNNPLTGIVFDFETKKSDNIIGYAAYFELVNGFHKTNYMTIEDLKKHGLKYSKTYGNEKTRKSSLWETDFESMAQKTVLKLLLSKYAPLSIEMQKAVTVDQSVIKNADATEVQYVDHEEISIDKEAERVRFFLERCETVEDIELLAASNPEMDKEIFEERKSQLKGKK